MVYGTCTFFFVCFVCFVVVIGLSAEWAITSRAAPFGVTWKSCAGREEIDR
jgi:hypothetical protein